MNKIEKRDFLDYGTPKGTVWSFVIAHVRSGVHYLNDLVNDLLNPGKK